MLDSRTRRDYKSFAMRHHHCAPPSAGPPPDRHLRRASRRSRIRLAWAGTASLIVALCTLAWARPTADPDPAAIAELTRQLQRLSLDVRQAPLGETERAAAIAQLATATLDTVYARYLDQWPLEDYLRWILNRWALPAAGPPVFLPLSRFTAADGRDVLYLPHRHPGVGVPCAPSETTEVRPWWSPRPVAICRESYRKEISFVDERYCPTNQSAAAGYVTPTACGCGSRLVHCLPPAELEPALVADAQHGVWEEFYRTAYEIAARRNRPLSEVFTATTTWQTGVVRFLYLRREIAGLLHGKTLTPTLEREIDRMLDTVDVHAPGAWVERKGIYRDTGVFLTTPLTFWDTYRGMVLAVFHNMLCLEPRSSNVDRDAILATVADHHANLRSLDPIADSPMRHQDGCKGCHMPMDTSSSFLFEMALGWRGGFDLKPRARTSSRLYLGSDDSRGEATGIAGLMKLAVAQPEFGRCTVRSAIQAVLQRFPLHAEMSAMDGLVAGFAQHDQSLPWLIKQLLLSNAYRRGEALAAAPRPATASVPARLGELVAAHCQRCHDARHATLDLTTLPGAADHAAWSAILDRVQDETMPPPRTDSIAARFPLDPHDRSELIDGIERLLGASADWRPRPRFMHPRTWAQIVTAWGTDYLGEPRARALVEAVAGERPSPTGRARGMSPTLQFQVDRASLAICQAIADADQARPAEQRRVIVDDGSDQARRRAVAELEQAVFGVAEPDAVADGVARYLRLRAQVTTTAAAWTALCTATLSGPRLWYEAYAPAGARP